MIRIRHNFIQSAKGDWVNLSHIKTLFVGGSSSHGFRICFSFDFYSRGRDSRPEIYHQQIGKEFSSYEDCQKELDDLLEALNEML